MHSLERVEGKQPNIVFAASLALLLSARFCGAAWLPCTVLVYDSKFDSRQARALQKSIARTEH